MDFNLKKFANDASGFFSRAKQLTEETFLKAEKTELDAALENLLQKADKTEEHTKKLLACMESYLQPNPTVRMEDVFYEKLELKKDNIRQNNLEHLGQAMTDAAEEFGSTTPYGLALKRVAETEFKLGGAERDFISASANNTLLPIRRFLEGDMKTIQKERKLLHSKRLDLDACKNRLKKAKTLESQTVQGSKNPVGFTVEQAEADLRVAQAEFDKQVEITKLLLEGIQTAYNNQLKCVKDFVEAQKSFYAQAHQHMAELQRDLNGAPSTSTVPSTTPIPTPKANGSEKVLDVDDMAAKQARVVMDYDAVSSLELSVKASDVLIVYRLPDLDPDYVMAEKGGRRGRVPLSFVELL